VARTPSIAGSATAPADAGEVRTDSALSMHDDGVGGAGDVQGGIRLLLCIFRRTTSHARTHVRTQH